MNGRRTRRGEGYCCVLYSGSRNSFPVAGLGDVRFCRRGAKEQRWQRLKRVRKVDEERERWLAMVNGWDPARRRSCGGEKGKMLRAGWDQAMGELEGLGLSAALRQKRVFWRSCAR